MIFGPVPVDQATGHILAHSIIADQPPHTHQVSYTIRKGTVLTAQHVADLVAYGHTQVTVAQIEAGDVTEDTAAARMAAAIALNPTQQGVQIGVASTGRVNLKADHAGIVRLDTAAIARMNLINPMLTLATVPQWQRVTAGQIIATLKVISYAVAEHDVQAACDVVAGAIAVLPPVITSATLIETQVGRDEPSPKGRTAMATRLGRFGIQLSDRVIVPHQVDPLTAAIADAPGTLVLILTASATSDVHDTAPQALRAAGGTVSQFGMPVDPGNLLFLGDFNQRPVIGLPGCARSLSMNGADWVLERIACGVPVTSADIAGMGVGGLLKDIPQRGRPRDHPA